VFRAQLTTRLAIVTERDTKKTCLELSIAPLSFFPSFLTDFAGRMRAMAARRTLLALAAEGNGFSNCCTMELADAGADGLCHYESMKRSRAWDDGCRQRSEGPRCAQRERAQRAELSLADAADDGRERERREPSSQRAQNGACAGRTTRSGGYSRGEMTLDGARGEGSGPRKSRGRLGSSTHGGPLLGVMRPGLGVIPGWSRTTGDIVRPLRALWTRALAAAVTTG
jgi:hypothetical protein